MPGKWESRGLPDFDGVVWFTRTVQWPDGAAGQQPDARAHRQRRRGLGQRTGDCRPAGLDRRAARAGDLRVARRRARKRGPTRSPSASGIFGATAGSSATPEAMYVQGGERKVSLAGTWRYRVERQTNAAPLYAKPGELAAHLALATSSAPAERGLSAAEPSPAAQAPDVVVKLGVIPHQLKFDKSELTVAPGQLVELVFANADVMQHNFLLGAPGSLQQIGSAADAMMTAAERRGAAVRAGACHRCCSPRHWSIPARPSPCGSGRPTSRDSTRTSARFPVIGA